MKTLIKVLLSVLPVFYFSTCFAFERADTTFTNDLNNDGTKDKITVSVDEKKGLIKLKVNDEKFTYMPETASGMIASVVRLNYKKYLIIINEAYDGYETNIFEYGNKIDSIYTFWSMNLPEIEERGVIKVTSWMGFWSANYEYHFKDNKLTTVYADEYKIPEEINENNIIVKTTLQLRSKKDENTKPSIEIKPGTRIFIEKADLRNKCKSEDRYEDGCNWYYIKSKDGKGGWIMLIDLQDTVEGIPWAG